jgi:hypothetical protein
MTFVAIDYQLIGELPGDFRRPEWIGGAILQYEQQISRRILGM